VTGILRAPRRAALATIALLVAAASITSFAESYRGLYDWAHEHGLTGPWAIAWPLQVDVFIAVGEAALFVALADRWPVRSRAAAWAVTLAGLAVSVAGNVGHVAGHDLASRVTAAVPPLAAAAALSVGLGVLKRTVAVYGSASVPAPGAPAPEVSPSGHAAPEGAPDAARLYAAELGAGELPSIRSIRREMHCGQDRAQSIAAYLAALGPGNGCEAAEHITRSLTPSGAPAYPQVTTSQNGDRQSPAPV
jgi:hypothetical protein